MYGAPHKFWKHLQMSLHLLEEFSGCIIRTSLILILWLSNFRKLFQFKSYNAQHSALEIIQDVRTKIKLVLFIYL